MLCFLSGLSCSNLLFIKFTNQSLGSKFIYGRLNVTRLINEKKRVNIYLIRNKTSVTFRVLESSVYSDPNLKTKL